MSEIGSGLTQLLRGTSTPQDARRVLLEKIGTIDQRIADLRALRKELHARTKLDCPSAVTGVTPTGASRGHRTLPHRGPHKSSQTSSGRSTIQKARDPERKRVRHVAAAVEEQSTVTSEMSTSMQRAVAEAKAMVGA